MEESVPADAIEMNDKGEPIIDTIPVKVAWAMADKLDCSIDEIVGRTPVTSGKSELQEFYDGLHP